MAVLRSALCVAGVALACAACASPATPGSPASGSTAAGPVPSARISGSSAASASEFDDIGLGPPPCALQQTSEFPWQPTPGGPAPYVVHRGQTVDVGVVLSSPPVAHTDDLRIDVVPATAHVINGAGGQLTDGTEPHVLRLDVANPAPGRYALTFRGLDDAARPLPDGDYQVYLLTVETTRRTATGCGPATPGPPASSYAPDAAYTADGTLLLGTIRLVG